VPRPLLSVMIKCIRTDMVKFQMGMIGSLPLFRISFNFVISLTGILITLLLTGIANGSPYLYKLFRGSERKWASRGNFSVVFVRRQQKNHLFYAIWIQNPLFFLLKMLISLKSYFFVHHLTCMIYGSKDHVESYHFIVLRFLLRVM